MKITKFCTNISAVIAFYGYSGLALAEDNVGGSSINYVVLAIFLAVLFVFRKKLIDNATPHPPHEEEHHKPAPQPRVESARQSPAPAATRAAAAPAPSPAPRRAATPSPAAAATAPRPAPPQQKALIDMSKNVEQCQGATAKGTRCKRNNNLETIDVTVEGQRYRFKTCRQHNNDAFKPFLS